MKRILVAGIISTVLSASACKNDGSGSDNPDAAKGIASDSLNREQQGRLALLGRTSAPTRYTEKIDGNRVRVAAINFGGTELGQCSDLAGNLLPGTCTPTGATLPAESLKTGTKDAPLNSGMFRQYSTQVGTTVTAKIEVGPAEAETTVYVSRNFLVLEWRRYNLEKITGYEALANAEQYFVSALEKGVAIRIVFDVALRTTDAKLSASFGIVDLSGALARNEATVEVSYEVLGTNLDLMPTNAITVTSLKEYLDLLAEFHRIVGLISKGSQLWSNAGGPVPDPSIPLGTIDLSEGSLRTPNPVEIKSNTFNPTILAYYVSGSGVGENYAELRNVDACNDVLARHQYIEHDLRWHHDMIAHHRTVARKKLSRASQRALDDAIREVRELHTSQRELMAEAAGLACVRTCVANGKRLKKVCSMLPEIDRAPVGCHYESQIDPNREVDCKRKYEWSYDSSLPLERKKQRAEKRPASNTPPANQGGGGRQ